MKQKMIVFCLLLSAISLSGCTQKATPGIDEPIIDNNTVESVPLADPALIPEVSPLTEPSNIAMLTEQEAKQIALAKVPGATTDNIYDFQKDTDDSVVKYEGEIRYNGTEYEFEIHAYDGTILEWDEEPLR